MPRLLLDFTVREFIALISRCFLNEFSTLDLSKEDVDYLSEKFWLSHTDPIWTMDGAAATLFTIQVNLCAGTIGRYLKQQPYLEETLQRVLSFEYSWVFFCGFDPSFDSNLSS